MATIGTQTLIGLPVVTQRGTVLGHVVSVELNIEQHAVQHYGVSQGGVLRRLQKEPELLIAPTQVISISTEKMVVVDMTSTEPVDAAEQWENSPAPTTSTEPVEPSAQ